MALWVGTKKNIRPAKKLLPQQFPKAAPESHLEIKKKQKTL